MYISLFKFQTPYGVYVLVHALSSLTPRFPKELQNMLDARLDPTSKQYDPTFPWDTAQVIALYHGLAEQPEALRFWLPDGRAVKMWNINLGCTNQIAARLADYAATIDVARVSLVSGDAPETAAQKVWDFCLANNIMQSMTSNQEHFPLVVSELRVLRSALIDDLTQLAMAQKGHKPAREYPTWTS